MSVGGRIKDIVISEPCPRTLNAQFGPLIQLSITLLTVAKPAGEMDAVVRRELSNSRTHSPLRVTGKVRASAHDRPENGVIEPVVGSGTWIDLRHQHGRKINLQASTENFDQRARVGRRRAMECHDGERLQ